MSTIKLTNPILIGTNANAWISFNGSINGWVFNNGEQIFEMQPIEKPRQKTRFELIIESQND